MQLVMLLTFHVPRFICDPPFITCVVLSSSRVLCEAMCKLIARSHFRDGDNADELGASNATSRYYELRKLRNRSCSTANHRSFHLSGTEDSCATILFKTSVRFEKAKDCRENLV